MDRVDFFIYAVMERVGAVRVRQGRRGASNIMLQEGRRRLQYRRSKARQGALMEAGGVEIRFRRSRGIKERRDGTRKKREYSISREKTEDSGRGIKLVIELLRPLEGPGRPEARCH